MKGLLLGCEGHRNYYRANDQRQPRFTLCSRARWRALVATPITQCAQLSHNIGAQATLNRVLFRCARLLVQVGVFVVHFHFAREPVRAHAVNAAAKRCVLNGSVAGDHNADRARDIHTPAFQSRDLRKRPAEKT